MMPISSFQYQQMLARTSPRRFKPNEEAVEDESPLHANIIDHCKNKGWRFIHSRMDRRSTVGNGVCDFIIAADTGRVFWIECKSKSGKLTMEQTVFIAWLSKLGHTVSVVTSMAEFKEAIT
jgi:hypothetical protein